MGEDLGAELIVWFKHGWFSQDTFSCFDLFPCILTLHKRSTFYGLTLHSQLVKNTLMNPMEQRALDIPVITRPGQHHFCKT